MIYVAWGALALIGAAIFIGTISINRRSGK